MSRTRFRKDGVEYRLWVRVDTENKRGFPDKLVGQLASLMRNPKWASQVKVADKHRIVVTTPVFDVIQSDLDVVPKSRASLFAESSKTGKFNPMRPFQDCKMYGDKVEYDRLLRAIRF